ncbi:MAG: hypothetical protein JWO79_1062 [Actinomycetia bacterium]|nr:hypothetical protein [Actinomycetes bacterium]
MGPVCADLGTVTGRRLKLVVGLLYVGIPGVLVAVAETLESDRLDSAAVLVTMPFSLVAAGPYLAALDAVDSAAPELWNWVNVMGAVLIAAVNLLLAWGAARGVRAGWRRLRRDWSGPARADRAEARRAVRAIPRATRIEVLRLAQRGERYPDPAVAAAAERYARLEFTPWPASAPSPLLPALGVLVVAAGFLGSDSLPLVLGVCVGVPVVLVGGLAWLVKRSWRPLTTLSPPLATVPEAR